MIRILCSKLTILLLVPCILHSCARIICGQLDEESPAGEEIRIDVQDEQKISLTIVCYETNQTPHYMKLSRSIARALIAAIKDEFPETAVNYPKEGIFITVFDEKGTKNDELAEYLKTLETSDHSKVEEALKQASEELLATPRIQNMLASALSHYFKNELKKNVTKEDVLAAIKRMRRSPCDACNPSELLMPSNWMSPAIELAAGITFLVMLVLPILDLKLPFDQLHCLLNFAQCSETLITDLQAAANTLVKTVILTPLCMSAYALCRFFFQSSMAVKQSCTIL